MHNKLALKTLALAAVLSVGGVAAPAPAQAAGISRNEVSKQLATNSAARQAAYCKNGVSYTFTYNSDGTIATMSWTYDECVAAGGK